MKKIIFLFSALIFSSLLFAQAPQGINYQGVARDAGGKALSNKNIGVQFTIIQSGNTKYQEYQITKTDTFGLYSLVIGSPTATVTNGSFAAIPWSGGNLSIQIGIDPNGATSFVPIATSALQSVPYALYANSAGSGGGGSISGTANNIPKINSAGNGIKKSLIFESTDSSSIGINTASPQPGAVLDISSNSKGLLIPRMSYAQRTGLTSNLHHGLTVFQTNSNSFPPAPEGFWYYDSLYTSWLYLPPAQAVWTLTGNYGTTPGSHFVGTLDAKDLVFKTGTSTFSPVERMRILNTTGQIQFGTTSSGEYKFPAVIGTPGQILQLDTGGSNNLYWKNISSGITPLWQHASGGLLYPHTITDTVGIGTTTPKSTLDVLSKNANGAINASNTGIDGSAGVFSVTNSANDSTALIAYTQGKGNAFFGINEGPIGHGGVFAVINSSSGGSGILASTNGSGKAVFGINQGTGGYAGAFMINNPANDSAALAGITNGKGPAVYGINLGIGGGGIFQIFNPSNNNTALYALTNGGGGAANFQINNSLNTSTALSVSTSGGGQGINVTSISGSAISASNTGGGHTINSVNNGTGGSAGNFQNASSSNGNPALTATASGGGDAIYGNLSSSGTAIVGYNSGGGKAGSFSMVSNSSTSDALYAVTTSTVGGFSGNFVGGAGLKTDKIRITQTGPQPGLVLSAINTNGDGAWTPLPGATNFGINVSSTAQTFNASTTNTVTLSTPTYTNGGASFTGNVFTAPANGVYHFDVQITVTNTNITSGGNITLALYDPTAPATYKQTQYNATTGGANNSYLQPFIISTDITLTAGQKVVLTLSNSSTGTNYTIITNPLLSWFNGHKVF